MPCKFLQPSFGGLWLATKPCLPVVKPLWCIGLGGGRLCLKKVSSAIWGPHSKWAWVVATHPILSPGQASPVSRQQQKWAGVAATHRSRHVGEGCNLPFGPNSKWVKTLRCQNSQKQGLGGGTSHPACGGPRRKNCFVLHTVQQHNRSLTLIANDDDGMPSNPKLS